MTYYEQWQLERYGNILPGSDMQPPDENETEVPLAQQPILLASYDQETKVVLVEGDNQ